MARDDDYVGCGISRLWALPQSHKFTGACTGHDAAYTAGSEEQRTSTRAVVDKKLLNGMLKASDDTLDKVQAYTMYGIVRALGWIWWEGK